MEETKSQRFGRIVEPRVQRALVAIGRVGNCGNRALYDYTSEEIEAIFAAFSKKLSETRARFQPKGSEAQFRLVARGD